MDVFTDAMAEKLGIRRAGSTEVNKNFDDAACLSYKIPKMYDEFDDDTKKNFEKVIDYIMSL